MTAGTNARRQPPEGLMDVMSTLRSGDNRAALTEAERALAVTDERAPFLAAASLAALRLGEPARAIPFLREIIQTRPDDLPSRVNLATALLQTGDADGALEMADASEEPQLARIEGYVRQQRGELEAAEQAYRRALAREPADLASWNNLGNVLSGLGQMEAAVGAFERAVTLAPADVQIYLNLAELLRKMDRPVPRLKVMRDAERIAPEDPRVLTELGLALVHAEEMESAIAAFEKAIANGEGFSEAHIELGLVFEGLNRTEELDRLVESVELDKAPAEAAFLLAWQARRAENFGEAAKLAERIPETVQPMRRWQLVGGIADRRERAEEAVRAFERMNDAALADAPSRGGPSYREMVEADLANWTEVWAASWPDISVEDGYTDPVFLVGFPRSGTTLLDTMLMGMRELSVLEERPLVASIVKGIGETDLAELDGTRIAALREKYFELARENGWDGTSWLVDKHPLNMQRLPLIHRLFPKARVILAERHPYDVVLSCFMANFRLNYAMRSFTSLEEAALTYDAVWRAWDRARQLFAVDVREVRYERLVEDPRAELEPLVAWLGLDWQDGLLDHRKTAKARGRVRTASYSQIGEQLYTRARYRWRRYEEQLEPVTPILRDWALKLGYEAD